MKITMDMSGYEIEPEDTESEYCEEIMDAGWNPAVELACELLQVTADEPTALFIELSEFDAMSDIPVDISEIGRRKMYSYRH